MNFLLAPFSTSLALLIIILTGRCPLHFVVYIASHPVSVSVSLISFTGIAVTKNACRDVPTDRKVLKTHFFLVRRDTNTREEPILNIAKKETLQRKPRHLCVEVPENTHESSVTFLCDKKNLWKKERKEEGSGKERCAGPPSPFVRSPAPYETAARGAKS